MRDDANRGFVLPSSSGVLGWAGWFCLLGFVSFPAVPGTLTLDRAAVWCLPSLREAPRAWGGRSPPRAEQQPGAGVLRTPGKGGAGDGRVWSARERRLLPGRSRLPQRKARGSSEPSPARGAGSVTGLWKWKKWEEGEGTQLTLPAAPRDGPFLSGVRLKTPRGYRSEEKTSSEELRNTVPGEGRARGVGNPPAPPRPTLMATGHRKPWSLLWGCFG